MITLDGLDDLQKRFAEVEAKIVKKALRQAVRKGMDPVRRQVKQNAPRDEGELQAAVALTTKADREGTFYAKVGVRGGAKDRGENPFYFRMHELGTRYIVARPFMRPALEQNAEQIADTVAEELRKALDAA